LSIVEGRPRIVTGQSARLDRRKKLVRKTKDERQREIVDATIQLLGEYGVQGTTVARIAAAVGVTKGALYQHFPNREAVLAAALAAMDERSSAWIAQSSGPDVPASLMAMGRAHSSWASSEYNTFVRPFFQLIAASKESELTAQIIDRQHRDHRVLTERAKEGQRQGSIGADVDPEELAWSLHMLAWAEDIAMLIGVDEFITEGVSARILQRLMGTYVAPAATPATTTEQ
jgi:AcrR family transcriptional regulator